MLAFGAKGNQARPYLAVGEPDRREAERLQNAMNESHRVPTINLNLARAYLAAHDPKGAITPSAGPANSDRPRADSACDVVLDYCAAVRGILNDDQGGPLHPPGLRMADALTEIRDSIQRDLDAKKGASQRRNSVD